MVSTLRSISGSDADINTIDDQAKKIQFPHIVDEKINCNVAIPAFENKDVQAADLDDQLSLPLDNKVDMNIAAPKAWTDRVNQELLRLDEMLLDPKCDPNLILQQAYRILNLLLRKTSQVEKAYVLDKEPELWKNVQELKGSFNTWKVLAIALASGVLTAAGGFAGIGSVVPGTAVGEGLAKAAPKFLQFLADAGNAKIISTVGEGMKGVGQGSDVFQKIFGNTDEAKRVVYNHLLEEGKRKQGERNDAYRQSRDQSIGANNNCRSVAETAHRTFESILKGTTA